jgi:hypothetical protein
VRTFDGGLQTVVATTCAAYQVTLRPSENVNDEPNQTSEEDQQHPKNGTVHATSLGIARYPNEKRNI